MPRINMRKLSRKAKVIASANPKIRQTVRKIVREEFKQIQDDFIEKVRAHVISREIEAGYANPLAPNISGTLSGVRGNLFSFIGFDRGKPNPINELEKILRQHKIKIVGKRGKYRIVIITPDKTEIFKKTSMEWAIGRSWVSAIEKGVSGLGLFIAGNYGDNPKINSRSEGGIQLRKRVRSAKFRNTSYLSPLLNEYQKRIEKIKA